VLTVIFPKGFDHGYGKVFTEVRFCGSNAFGMQYKLKLRHGIIVRH
jgi:hypothetical protein